MTTWPHDDTAALVAFYGDPRPDLAKWEAANLVDVTPPWQMFYGRIAIKHFRFHRRAAPALQSALGKIWSVYGQSQERIAATGLHNYSGSMNDRMVRGSTSKMSCHYFGAAIDFDAEHEPMNYKHISHVPQPVIDAFDAEGFFWGGRFKTRQDPMHWQAAHE